MKYLVLCRMIAWLTLGLTSDNPVFIDVKQVQQFVAIRDDRSVNCGLGDSLVVVLALLSPTDFHHASKISASNLRFYAFNYCLLGCWVGNLSSFKIFVIDWSWSQHPCNKSCVSCQNNWWNESNLKFNVLSSIMLCCKYSWLYYTDSELKPIHHILHLEHLRGISFLM